ncbi:unnamed protein product [Vicia faba]|uniref:XS domain-containing protein n=1 Tax=Vicia faba TaxID=3906 RepID=A0AAV1A4X4_VICFA|nr:unnamed protein product [Vicia faba]
MAGGNNPKPSSSSHRKTRWESNSSAAPAATTTTTITTNTKSPSDPKLKPNTNNPNPNPKPNPNPSPKLPNNHPALIPFQFPEPGPLPPPAYGFHMLERRTIILADGSVRSYFALPPDYQDFPPPPRPLDRFDMRFPPRPDYQNPLEASLAKRKYGEDGRDEFARQREQLLRNANGFANRVPGGEFPAGPSGPLKRDTMEPVDLRPSKQLRVDGVGSANNARHPQVDQEALKKTFLHFVRLINENPSLKKSFSEKGKQGRVQCVACGNGSNRAAKEFSDIHALIMHTYNSDNADLRADHLGLHKALCVLMGWNHSTPPDNSKAYQYLSADEAEANQEDLIMWPPLVIIHNTNTEKSRDGRMEGLGNKWMDNKIRELGFGGGKSKALYGKEGHLGITVVKFADDKSGLEQAMRLAEHFKKENHGRKDWARAHAQSLGKEDENNPNLVQVDEKKGEKRKVLYGYLGTAFDIDKLDFDTRKKVVIKSRREYKPSM